MPRRHGKINFDPAALLLAQLTASFGDVAHFFYDRCGGSVIGVVWAPQVTKSD